MEQPAPSRPEPLDIRFAVATATALASLIISVLWVLFRDGARFS